VAGVLIQMKLALLRRGLTQGRAGQLAVGVALGLLLAVATLSLGVIGVSADLLAAAFAVWALGWLLGPLFAGGGEGDLRPEYFIRLPMTPRTLAKGLLSAALVGAGPVLTAVAFAALVALSVRWGALPGLVAVPAAAVQVVVLVLASRVLIGTLGEVMRSRLGAALVALLWAVIIASASNIGIILYALGQNELMGGGFTPWLATAVRVLPSGWAVVAVEAASRSDWLVCAAALLGLAALIAALLVAWSTLLNRRLTGALGRSSAPLASGDFWYGSCRRVRWDRSSPRSCSRDMLRSYFWYFAVAFGVVVCTTPLLVGLTAYLPWMGSLVTATGRRRRRQPLQRRRDRPVADADAPRHGAAGRTRPAARLAPAGRAGGGRAHRRRDVVRLPLVGADPAGGRARGRSRTCGAALRGGAGPDAGRAPPYHQPRVDGGNITGLVWTMIGLTVACALPATGVVLAGTLLDQAVLLWAGVAAGLATGAFYFWLFGRVAHGQLRRTGPELLYRLRTGRRAELAPIPRDLARRPSRMRVADPLTMAVAAPVRRRAPQDLRRRHPQHAQRRSGRYRLDRSRRRRPTALHPTRLPPDVHHRRHHERASPAHRADHRSRHQRHPRLQGDLSRRSNPSAPGVSGPATRTSTFRGVPRSHRRGVAGVPRTLRTPEGLHRDMRPRLRHPLHP
jgi:ABC-2 type transport system permease protein